MKLKIRKGATVEVIAGAEKGKRGAVLDVNANQPGRIRIKVQGIAVRTHFDKKEGQLKKEAYFDYSNVRLIEAAAPKKAAKKTSKKTASAKA